MESIKHGTTTWGTCIVGGFIFSLVIVDIDTVRINCGRWEKISKSADYALFYPPAYKMTRKNCLILNDE